MGKGGFARLASRIETIVFRILELRLKVPLLGAEIASMQLVYRVRSIAFRMVVLACLVYCAQIVRACV